MNIIDVFDKPKDKLNFFETDINATDSESFIKQFKEICLCNTATKVRSICYVWYTKKLIPRLKSSSKIIYIGKTKNTFEERHSQYAKLEGSGYNWKRYQHIISKYGPIKMVCCSVESPREFEKEMLKRYKNEHLETPPINASS